MLEKKRCYKCKQEKSAAFDFSPKGKLCRECNREQSAASRAKMGVVKGNRWKPLKFGSGKAKVIHECDEYIDVKKS